jgi:lysophospholipase L1-like esterase
MFRPRSVLALAVCAILIAAGQTRAEFPLKDGDIWVMAGDSITAQHQHSNYFEAFCYARYPKMKFGFRNSGVGGHTIPTTLARFGYDIAAWKPTIVSVELGMNDKNGTMTEKFVDNMGIMVKRIRDIGARPVIFSASPVNDGITTATLGTSGNKRLHDYANALKVFSAKENIPYADQFHDLIDVWGKNKPNEKQADALNQVKILAKNDNLKGVEHLREFIAIHEKSGVPLVSMRGDAVHPAEPGQLMMAASLLKRLGAEPFVSSAAINVGNKQVDAKGCIVESLTIGDGKIAFDRLDERLPFPIPEAARDIVAFDPTVLEMSQYTLKVAGLKPGVYKLTIDGGAVADVSAKDLEGGINLTAFGPGAKASNPIAAQGTAILDAVSKRAKIVGQWRNESKAAHAKSAAAEAIAQLADITNRVNEADNAIRAAATPRKMHVELIASATR